MSDKFDQYFDSSVRFTKEKFLERGELTQSILLGWDKENTSTVIVFENYDEEMSENLGIILDKAIREIQDEKGVEGQPDWFIQIAESWMVKIDGGDVPEGKQPHLDVRPSEHPDRTEALIVHGNKRDGTGKSWTVDIYREPNLHLGEPNESMKDIKARVADLLWNQKDTRKIDDVFNQMMGENPSDQEVLIASSGWINATVKSGLGNVLPANIRMGLLRAANLIAEHAATL